MRVSRQTRQPGFTLIELMITVAIVATLSAIAVPAYQDYVVRSQVAEGFVLSTAAKEAIVDYYGNHGAFPNGNSAADLPTPASIRGRYVESVTVGTGDGSIRIVFSTDASARIASSTLELRATDRAGSITWDCSGLTDRHLPSSCR